MQKRLHGSRSASNGIKVSVVIPAHNEEEYITKTLEAVCAQDFPGPFEIIVVDNASTDDTGNIALLFSQVRVVREERKGTGWAREKGRKEAQGEIIAYLDADSIPSPDWLRKGVFYFSNSRVVAVAGVYDYYDAPLSVRVAAFFIEYFFYRFIHFLLHFVLRKGGVIIGGNFFVRASALEEIGGMNTAILFHGDDTDTAKRLTKVGKIIYNPSLTVKSSARRLEEKGAVRTLALYVINFLWIILLDKPFSQKS